jgi:hypothetical protein
LLRLLLLGFLLLFQLRLLVVLSLAVFGIFFFSPLSHALALPFSLVLVALVVVFILSAVAFIATAAVALFRHRSDHDVPGHVDLVDRCCHEVRGDALAQSTTLPSAELALGLGSNFRDGVTHTVVPRAGGKAAGGGAEKNSAQAT